MRARRWRWTVVAAGCVAACAALTSSEDVGAAETEFVVTCPASVALKAGAPSGWSSGGQYNATASVASADKMLDKWRLRCNYIVPGASSADTYLQQVVEAESCYAKKTSTKWVFVCKKVAYRKPLP